MTQEVDDLLQANANLQAAFDEVNEELQRYGEEKRRLRSTNIADLVYPPFGESFTMPTREIDWQWIRDNCVIVRAGTLAERDAEIERLRDFIATLARDYERALDTAKQESTRLLAEIDRRGEEEGRLRELLRQSLIHYPFNNPAEAAAFNEAKRLWGKRVREALGK